MGRISKEEAQRLIERRDKLYTDQSNWRSHWEDVTSWCIPRKGGIIGASTPGNKLMADVYDTTAMGALEDFASGMGYLTPSTSRWGLFKTRSRDLNKDPQIKEYLQECERIFYDVIHGSNFVSQIDESNLDDGSIGTSIIYAEEDLQDVLRFSTRHIAECVIDVDSKARVDTLFRTFEFNGRKTLQEYGSAALDEKTLKQIEKDPKQPHKFIHGVFPREDFKTQSLASVELPWASVTLHYESKRPVKESGYHEFPYAVNRWRLGTGEIYGRSCAMNALADIKMLNEMDKTLIKGGQKAVSPPTFMPHDGVVGDVRLVPDGITYINSKMLIAGAGPQQFKFAGNIPLGWEMSDRRRQMIKERFFVDLFRMLINRASPEKTATEVMELVDEKMGVLGPILGRSMREKLDPLVERSFGLLYRGGYFPPAPAPLRELFEYYQVRAVLAVEYVSPLAKLQRQWERKAIAKTLQDISPLCEFFPEIVDNIDPDAIFEIVAEINGYPETARRQKKIIGEIRKARQQVATEESQKEDLERLVQTVSQAQNLQVAT